MVGLNAMQMGRSSFMPGSWDVVGLFEMKLVIWFMPIAQVVLLL